MSMFGDDEDDDDMSSVGKAAALNGALGAGFSGMEGATSGLEGKNLLKYMALNGILSGAGGGAGQAIGGNVGGFLGGIGGHVLGESEVGAKIGEHAGSGLKNVAKYIMKLRGK